MTDFPSLAFDVFRFSFAAVFLGLHLALMLGLLLERLRDLGARRAARAAAAAAAAEPLVSVVVPVHDEAERMGPLLESLLRQDYGALEFVFVDDRSSDGTAELLRRFAERAAAAGRRARVLTLTENPGPNFKQYALGKGIEAAEGELLLLTDGDCEVPESWASGMAERMVVEGTGAVLGPVFKRIGGPGFFHLYQGFDHGVRYMYLAASTGLGSAGGGFGNNLIVRRAALEAIGGYASVPYSVTEDAALIARIRARSSFAVRAVCAHDVRVLTAGESTWGAFVRQTLRWNNGGLFSPDLATRLNFGFLMVTISAGVLALPLLPFVPGLWPLPAAVYLSMAMNTLATVSLAGSALPRSGAAYLPQLLFTPAYFTFLTVLGFAGMRVSWKGKTLQ